MTFSSTWQPRRPGEEWRTRPDCMGCLYTGRISTDVAAFRTIAEVPCCLQTQCSVLSAPWAGVASAIGEAKSERYSAFATSTTMQWINCFSTSQYRVGPRPRRTDELRPERATWMAAPTGSRHTWARARDAFLELDTHGNFEEAAGAQTVVDIRRLRRSAVTSAAAVE